MKNRISVYRWENHLSTYTLEGILGISTEEQRKIENGEKDPSVKLIKKYVKALKTPAGKLFPEFDLDLTVEYENREEELMTAERIISFERMRAVLLVDKSENTKESQKLITAYDTAIACIRNELRAYRKEKRKDAN